MAHSSSKQGQSTGFVGKVDWADYMKHRPKYPQSWYERIYTQIEKSGGSFEVVNDTGAGGGVASQVLAKKFDKVVVSEPNTEFLSWAKERLPPMFPAGKFEFLEEGAEKSSVNDASTDAVTICEALHWCDIPSVLNEFHRQLKPGGVMCIMHYSSPSLINTEAQKVWSGMWAKSLAALTGPVYERNGKNMARGYEDIVFASVKWTDVKRVLVNCNGSWEAIAKDFKGQEVPPSGVQEGEEVVYEEENGDLGIDVDLEGLKAVYYAMLPWDEDGDRDREDWGKLEKIMGKEGRFKGYYPATQLIATKK